MVLKYFWQIRRFNIGQLNNVRGTSEKMDDDKSKSFYFVNLTLLARISYIACGNVSTCLVLNHNKLIITILNYETVFFASLVLAMPSTRQNTV